MTTVNGELREIQEFLDSDTSAHQNSGMGVAAAFIKIDAEVHRVKVALKLMPDDLTLQKELNSLVKAREKLLLEAQRKARSSESK